MDGDRDVKNTATGNITSGWIWVDRDERTSALPTSIMNTIRPRYTSLPSPLSNWPTGLGMEGVTGETDGKKRMGNFETTLGVRVNWESYWNSKTKPSIWWTIRLPAEAQFIFFTTSLLSHLLFPYSFFPLLPVSPNPLVASVFHFKLDCWDLNLIGCWAKSERKKQRQTDRAGALVEQHKGKQKECWEKTLEKIAHM